jgi:hypothetical protein
VPSVAHTPAPTSAPALPAAVEATAGRGTVVPVVGQPDLAAGVDLRRRWSVARDGDGTARDDGRGRWMRGIKPRRRRPSARTDFRRRTPVTAGRRGRG